MGWGEGGGGSRVYCSEGAQWRGVLGILGPPPPLSLASGVRKGIWPKIVRNVKIVRLADRAYSKGGRGGGLLCNLCWIVEIFCC